jgi:putative tryptophan/tyrosine transport system substrate-binding protein
MRYLSGIAGLITVFATATPADAQQPSINPPLVGWLRMSPPLPPGDKLLRDLLAARGHIAGRTIRFETRSADNEVKRLPALARELVGEGAAVLITLGIPATRAARDETAAIPIVAVTDLVRWGIAASMASPGGNVTGVHIYNEELDVKKLEILKELLPTSRHIGVLSDAATPYPALPMDEAARALGLELTTVTVKDPADFEAAFETFAKASVNAVNIRNTTLFASSRLVLAPILRRHSIPAICEWREMAASGCLASYGATQNEMFTLVADYVDRILKGAKPAELPIVQPTRFELVINKTVAREIGLTIQQRMLERADEVME